MKHIKLYEEKGGKKYKYKKNTLVKVDTLIKSTKEKVFVIMHRIMGLNHENKYGLVDIDKSNDQRTLWEHESNIRKATKDDIAEYEMIMDTKKFNI